MGDIAPACLIALVIFVILVLIRMWFILVSWNAVMPDIFGLTEINAAQAFWLSILSSSLFTSWTGSANKKE